MTFQQLLDGAEVLSQSGDPGVSSVEYDSRRVKPGCVFVAMQGETSDGNRFIDQAIRRARSQSSRIHRNRSPAKAWPGPSFLMDAALWRG